MHGFSGMITKAMTTNGIKIDFVETLDRPHDLNEGKKSQTRLLKDMVNLRGGLMDPG